ncbi:MAG: glycosyltransferase 87 family protein [Chloroflexota bacterium]
MPSRRTTATDRWSAAWALTLAAFLLGFAVQLDFGTLDPGAILLLSLALPLTLVAVIGPRWDALQASNVRFALGLVLIAQFGLLLAWPPGSSSAVQDDGALLPYRLGLAAAGIVALLDLADRPALRRTRLVALLALWGVAAAWVVVMEPFPRNDVWWFQQLGGQALLDGINPYAMQMPNVYAPDTSLYAPELVDGDRLTVGFLYPPLSLLLALPGLLVAGDVRFAHIVVVLVAALLIATMRPGPIARGAALVFLFTPRSFFVIEQGWTDPQTVLGVAVIVWVALRRLNPLPIALGLAVAVKQHMALLLPLTLLLIPRPIHWRRVALAGGVAMGLAVAVTLPFVLADPTAFWHSVVEAQFRQPFRTDALSYLAWLGMDDPRLALIGFAALVPAGVLVAWRGARTPAGFAAATALVYLCFVAFNKQAFVNYYYFVIGAMCCAIAATAPAVEPQA